MSGLLALLDDVAGIAKIAAASVDDVVWQATKAGSKAAGAVVDDAAVTPKYLHGISPARELPIVWRIAKGSIKNKLLYLLPAALLLSAFAPWAITPLLMLGGAYLCFEGGEKVLHAISGGSAHADRTETAEADPAHLEEKKAAGAIKTDFILSAEIMTIALAALPIDNVWMQAAALVAVAVGITVIVYGAVALIVKADDIGLAMAERGRLALTRRLGRALVKAMPGFLKGLTVVGTAAMLWVGGSILVHGLEGLGAPWLGHAIHDLAAAAGQGGASLEWLVTAACNGVVGLAVGLALVPVVTRALLPVAARFRQ